MAKSKKSQIRKDFGKLNDIVEKFSELKQYRSKVGILTGKASEQHGNFKTNVEIGIIHEFGSITRNIPERSFLRMPLKLKKKELLNKLKNNKDKIIELIEDGEIKQIFSNLGVEAEGIIQDAFETRGFSEWPDNSPITVTGGWMRNKKTGQLIFIKGKQSDQPLIDTGQLRRSITSKVIKK